MGALLHRTPGGGRSDRCFDSPHRTGRCHPINDTGEQTATATPTTLMLLECHTTCRKDPREEQRHVPPQNIGMRVEGRGARSVDDLCGHELIDHQLRRRGEFTNVEELTRRGCLEGDSDY